MNIKRFFKRISIAILSIVILVFTSNFVLASIEKKIYKAPGELVQVHSENIHVYTKGSGENTIVLLSGLGTAAPTLDFEPLINELSKNSKVVVVEPFGYGWSDVTNKQRTVENIVEEIRTALKKANINGPYTLIPHSISGIYSMYYANKYPNEIKAIVGIDFTLPKASEYFGESYPTFPTYMSYLAPSGLGRIALLISPENFLPISEPGVYSEENLKLTKKISAWKGYNKNVVDEGNEIKNNINKTLDMSFPTDLPVLIFTEEPSKVRDDGKSNVSFYETYLKYLDKGEVVLLKGHHYLHWTCYKEISEKVNEFMNE
jgi:pimeloyl-ACP methyl ester carboxylesterase